MIMKKIKYLGMLMLALSLAFTACNNDPEEPDFPEPGTETGDGSESSPYNVTAAIKNNSGEKWVKGYIVGYAWAGTSAQGTIYTFSSDTCTQATNILIADSKNETTATKVMPVQLLFGDIRTGLNLAANKDNIGKEVTLYGSLEKYFSIAGLKSVSYYELEGGKTGGTKPGGQPGELEGAGLKADPYVTNDIYVLNPQSTTEAVKSGVWTKGFIVGYYNNETRAMETTPPFAKDENLMLAATAGETDMAKCVCVQIPYGDVRTALGLATKPENLGKEIMVYGDIMKYNTFPGVKNTVGYWDIAGNVGIDPPQGDFDVPYMTIAEVRSLWTGTAAKITENKKITGIVVSDLVGGNSSSKKNFVITSVDNSIGLMIRVTESEHSYNLGDKIEINVNNVELATYGEALQLNNLALAKTRKIGTATVTPKVMSIADLRDNYAQHESSVVTVTGTITSGGGGTWYSGSAQGQNNTIDKDGSQLVMYVTKFATFGNQTVPSEEKTVTGIVGRFNDTYQLIIRNLEDVK